MKPSLLELVDVILQKITERPEALPSESGIRTWLVRQGYAKRDIDAAMKLVRPRFQDVPHVVEQGPGKLRQLSNFESMRFTEEARNALVRLELYELLDPSEREAILDRLDQFDGEIGMAELDYLVSWVLSGSRDYEYQQTVFNVMEGKTESLH